MAILLILATAIVAIPQVARAAGNTVVSLTFNDGLLSQYQYGRPVLQAHNMLGTFYVSSKVIEASATGYMATWHVDDLYRDGDEIGGITKDHVDLTDPSTTTAYKQDQVCGDKARLAQLGYDPQSFAYPYAALDPAAEAIVQGCGYLSGRTVGGLSTTTGPYAETIPPADAFHISTANSPSGAVQLADLQAAVNAASANGGGWLPIAFDQVCGSADPNYASCMSSYHPIDAGVFSTFLDWLQSGAPAGTTVQRVRDVMGAPPQPILPPRPTQVSLTFDDGDRSQYGVRSIFASHNVHGTFYINSGAVDAREAGAMTWTQIHNLADDGNDIGGHTLTHTDMTDPNTTYDFKWHEACYDRARLQAQGFSPKHFAYPFAAFNATAAGILQACGYLSGRTGGSLLVGGPLFSETVPPAEPYTFKALGTTYDGPITLQWLQDAVNGAANRAGGWIPVLFHEICYAGTATFDTCMAGYRTVSDTVLTQFLDWTAANAYRGISVKSVDEVLFPGKSVPNVVVTSPAVSGRTTTSPTITGTAASTGGDITVSLYQGPYSTGTPVATATATNNGGSWTTTFAGPLPAGTYTVQAKQTGDGVTGTSAPTTFMASDDFTPPTVQLTAPADGSRIGTTTPVISGTAGTAPDDLPAITVRIYNGSTATGTPRQTLTTNASGGLWSVAAAALPQNTFTVQATQSDAPGNVGTSNTATFVVDTAAPVVRITSPASNTAITSPTPFSVTGTAGTATGDLADITLNVYAGTTATGTPIRTLTTTATAGVYSVLMNDLGVGSFTLRASQSDVAGNTGNSNSVVVRVRSSMTVTSASPATAGQGASARTIDLVGTGFTANTTAALSGTGLTIRSTTLVSATRLRLVVDVAADATTGARTATVSQPGTYDATCANCLTINAGPQPTSASPSSLRAGGPATTVTISGSGFTSSSQVTWSGTGITSTVRSRSATTITLTVTAGAGAAPGARDVTVTNSDGGTGTCAGCLTITT